MDFRTSLIKLFSVHLLLLSLILKQIRWHYWLKLTKQTILSQPIFLYISLVFVKFVTNC